MTIFLNIALFVATGLFGILFFNGGDFYGTAGFLISRTSLLYILGGAILIVGGLVRAVGPGIELTHPPRPAADLGESSTLGKRPSPVEKP